MTHSSTILSALFTSYRIAARLRLRLRLRLRPLTILTQSSLASMVASFASNLCRSYELSCPVREESNCENLHSQCRLFSPLRVFTPPLSLSVLRRTRSRQKDEIEHTDNSQSPKLVILWLFCQGGSLSLSRPIPSLIRRRRCFLAPRPKTRTQRSIRVIRPPLLSLSRLLALLDRRRYR